LTHIPGGRYGPLRPEHFRFCFSVVSSPADDCALHPALVWRDTGGLVNGAVVFPGFPDRWLRLRLLADGARPGQEAGLGASGRADGFARGHRGAGIFVAVAHYAGRQLETAQRGYAHQRHF
jgi:hypothetical protein